MARTEVAARSVRNSTAFPAIGCRADQAPDASAARRSRADIGIEIGKGAPALAHRAASLDRKPCGEHGRTPPAPDIGAACPHFQLVVFVRRHARTCRAVEVAMVMVRSMLERSRRGLPATPSEGAPMPPRQTQPGSAARAAAVLSADRVDENRPTACSKTMLGKHEVDELSIIRRFDELRPARGPMLKGSDGAIALRVNSKLQLPVAF